MERRISTQPIYQGKLLDIWRDEVELPDGSHSIREYTKHPGAVVMIPVLPDGRIGLIRQYRYPIGQVEIELPAGKIDPGETHEETALRELEEEIGYQTGKLTELTEIHPCIGYSDERMWLYLAEELHRTKANSDHDEFIEFFPLFLSRALELVWSGEITDVKTIIGLLWAERVLPNQNDQPNLKK